MRLIVMSDSHGDFDTLCEIVKAHPDIEKIAFLGDGISEMERVCSLYPNKQFFIVSGNNDSKKYPLILEIMLGENKILLAHGHKFGVKNGLYSLFDEAVRRDCTAVLYGHTHVSSIINNNGIIFVNPGCANRIWSSIPSYAVITSQEIGIDVQIRNLR